MPKSYSVMKKSSVVLLLVALILVPASQAQTPTFRPVREGLEHLQLTRGQASADEATGPLVINLLRVDLHKVEVRVVHALDEAIGLETTSSMAARYGAIAAT